MPTVFYFYKYLKQCWSRIANWNYISSPGAEEGGGGNNHHKAPDVKLSLQGLCAADLGTVGENPDTAAFFLLFHLN